MNKVPRSPKNILRFTTQTGLNKKILKNIQFILDVKQIYICNLSSYYSAFIICFRFL